VQQSSSATLNPKLSNTYTVRCKMEDGIKTYINGICIVRLCSGDVEDLDETEAKDAMVLAGHDPLRIIRDAAAVAVSTHGSTLAAKAKAKYEVKGGVVILLPYRLKPPSSSRSVASHTSACRYSRALYNTDTGTMCTLMA